MRKVGEFLEPETPEPKNVIKVAQIQQPKNAPSIAAVEPDTADHTEHDTMIGPLQSELELKKKENDLPSYYNDHDGEAPEIGDDQALSAGDDVNQLMGLVKRLVIQTQR